MYALDASGYYQPSSPSSSSSDESLLSLSFPKKLWKLVNECTTGAIFWSADGTAVVIDFDKFQSDYLDSQSDIFKMSSMASFVRQLNLYGFRKVSPYRRHNASRTGSPNVHVYRHGSFVKGRPDMLLRVTRRKAASRSRSNTKQDGGFPGSSSGRSQQCFWHVRDEGGLRIRENALSSRENNRALKRALERPQLDEELARLRKSLWRRPGAPLGSVGTSSSLTGIDRRGGCLYSMLEEPKDLTSDSDTSDEEYGRSLYSAAKKRAMSAGSSTTAAGELVVVEYVDPIVDGLIQRTVPRSESPPDGYERDVKAPLEPSK